jgi:enoyl-CoA hydratase/carnithine racemase
MTGRSMSAEEGAAWGFFNALHPREEVLARAQALARSLADGPYFAHTVTKTMLNQEWAMGIEEMIESEAQALARQAEQQGRSHSSKPSANISRTVSRSMRE